MAIYDRHSNKLDLIGAVKFVPGLWALHKRLASNRTADVQLAESSYLRADNGWDEIEAACEALTASTTLDIARRDRDDFDAMLKRVAKRRKRPGTTGSSYCE